MDRNRIPYFPLSAHTVQYVDDEKLVSVWFASRVRKQNEDGYWYTFVVTEQLLIPAGEYSVELLMEKKDLFLNFCYLKQIVTEFAPDRYKVDEEQISEQRRLTKMYNSWVGIMRKT